jgi:ParB-like chromosome segregation protein Spo0J
MARAVRRLQIGRVMPNPSNRIYRRKVTEYRARLHDGETLEPIHLARFDGGYWIIDGHHRHEAHMLEGRRTIRACVVIE